MKESVRVVLRRNEYRMNNTPIEEDKEIFRKAGDIIRDIFKDDDFVKPVATYLKFDDIKTLQELRDIVKTMEFFWKKDELSVSSVVNWYIIRIIKTEYEIEERDKIINHHLNNNKYSENVVNTIKNLFFEKPIEFNSVIGYLSSKYGCHFENLNNKQTFELIRFLHQYVDKTNYTGDDRNILKVLFYIFQDSFN